jgi:hypothetical protein
VKNGIEPRIAKLSGIVEPSDPALTYPLKIRVTMRNDSTQCVDVRLSAYLENRVSAKQPFVTKALQLELSNEWLPKINGEVRIAVLPGQCFRAWVGLDDKLFTREQIEKHEGQIGILILLVNDKMLEISL